MAGTLWNTVVSGTEEPAEISEEDRRSEGGKSWRGAWAGSLETRVSASDTSLVIRQIS